MTAVEEEPEWTVEVIWEYRTEVKVRGSDLQAATARATGRSLTMLSEIAPSLKVKVIEAPEGMYLIPPGRLDA